MSKPTTHERKADAENVLTCVMLRSPFEMAQVSHRLHRDMLEPNNGVGIACLELHAEQYTYTTLEVATRCGLRFDEVLQRSMQHPEVDLETAVDMFLLAYEQTVEELIGQSVQYWTSKGMGTDEVRSESEKTRKDKHVGAFVKADNGKADFEKSLLKSLDGLEDVHPIQPFLSSLQKSVGYWKPGDFIIQAGRTGMGKSYAGLNQIHYSAKQGHHMHYINLENAAPDVQMRLWQFETGQRFQNPFRGLSDQKRTEYTEAWERVKKMPIQAHNPGRSLSNIVTAIRREYYERGTALVVVDYIQLIRSGVRGTKLDDLSETSATLRQLALELGIPIMAMAQIGRAAETTATKRPSISDLRGSGDFEQDATTVLLLYRPGYYDLTADTDGKDYHPDHADITIGKGRNTGRAICECRFDAVRGFYNVTDDRPGASGYTSQFPQIERTEDLPF